MGYPPPGYYDPPTGHRPECGCRKCHLEHIDLSQVHENAASAADGDFECCVREIEGKIYIGELCEKHWREAYSEKNYCESCDA